MNPLWHAALIVKSKLHAPVKKCINTRRKAIGRLNVRALAYAVQGSGDHQRNSSNSGHGLSE
jgi:hypothetical protein